METGYLAYVTFTVGGVYCAGGQVSLSDWHQISNRITVPNGNIRFEFESFISDHFTGGIDDISLIVISGPDVPVCPAVVGIPT